MRLRIRQEEIETRILVIALAFGTTRVGTVIKRLVISLSWNGNSSSVHRSSRNRGCHALKHFEQGIERAMLQTNVAIYLCGSY